MAAIERVAAHQVWPLHIHMDYQYYCIHVIAITHFLIIDRKYSSVSVCFTSFPFFIQATWLGGGYIRGHTEEY